MESCMHRRWENALVTGASSGIGRSMTAMLAAEGTNVVAVGRNHEALESLAAELTAAPGSIEPLVADLADPEDLATVAQRVGSTEHPIDLLVNNAGLGFIGDFVDVSDDRANVQIDVNIVALQTLSSAAARAMLERKSPSTGTARGALGTILNVSSLAGDVPGPRSATYNATKAFVTSLSESLHLELADRGIVVSCLCPGLTRTDFQARAEYDTSDIPDALWQSADAVAAIGLDAAAAGKAVVVSGAVNKAASALSRLAPRSVTRWSTAALNRK